MLHLFHSRRRMGARLPDAICLAGLPTLYALAISQGHFCTRNWIGSCEVTPRIAFAIALALHRRGVFTWDEWAVTIGDEIKRAQTEGDPDRGDTYYRHWLAAIERIVREKGLTNAATLQRYRDAWDRAADRTPHGEPIVLNETDLT